MFARSIVFEAILGGEVAECEHPGGDRRQRAWIQGSYRRGRRHERIEGQLDGAA